MYEQRSAWLRALGRVGPFAIVHAREKAEKTLGGNGADEISNIEGKVARVATSKLGNERVSNSTSARSTMPCSSSARCRCPLSPRGSTASSPKTAKVLTRIWSEQISVPSVLLLDPVLIYCEFMRLRLVVEYDSETKRWAAFFPELPGCASAGDTEDEAIQNAKEALELWFEPTPVDLPAGAKVLEVALR